MYIYIHAYVYIHTYAYIFWTYKKYANISRKYKINFSLHFFHCYSELYRITIKIRNIEKNIKNPERNKENIGRNR